MLELTPDLLLQAYAEGLFPMADSAASDQLYWFDPDRRGILPLDGFHVPRRLRRTLRQEVFEVRVDSAFARVINACAAALLGWGAEPSGSAICSGAPGFRLIQTPWRNARRRDGRSGRA